MLKLTSLTYYLSKVIYLILKLSKASNKIYVWDKNGSIPVLVLRKKLSDLCSVTIYLSPNYLKLQATAAW